MTKITIYDRNGWRLVSYGRGWAYELTDTQTGESCWFQDDDASEFASHIMDADGWLVDNVEARFADYSDVMDTPAQA